MAKSFAATITGANMATPRFGPASICPHPERSSTMPKHRIKLHHQKMAIDRAVDILAEEYPNRIKAGKATEDGMHNHIDYLLEAMATIDGLCERRDMREDL
jgi:hypothetical protein